MNKKKNLNGEKYEYACCERCDWELEQHAPGEAPL